MEEIKNIIDRLLSGETVKFPANDEHYKDIKQAINAQGFVLNWNHTRYNPYITMFINF